MIQLEHHQIDAINKLKNGCVLRGGTGSGKTLTSLVYVFEKVLGGQSPVHPGHTFRKQIDESKVYIITTPRKRDTCDWEKEAALIPVKLESVDSWNNIKKYEHIKDAVFIFDETKILGYGAWTYSFLKIVKHNRWILLTATPGDTWLEYAPLFVANGFYKNKTEFEREHIVWARYVKYPKVERYLNITKLIKHRDSILVNMHFERSTVQLHNDILCEYDKVLYDVILKDRWNPYTNQPVRNISELCYILRKVLNSDESRVSILLPIYERHKKVIIFYTYDYELEILREWCIDNNIIFAEWNGHKHEVIPNNKTWAYLCQYTSAQEAWNCIETDCIIFYSQTYSYKALIQASGRIDRMNTTYKNLYYYHLISQGSIDESIQKALLHKENFNESAWLGGR